ncbi:uncharacterized protein BO88DRAFT_18892 [Aspergillus vadensis CBS 113365]|uniref:Uncharacterized protein n=1 Tax=Aspergillus vadensis (strain CBS 113365 / IMI 142717 / IBT 24658) TaxID=1448311 RepID=A0A319BPP6_ASPVC|nr:hypothetical protein BO88DRAFT_18892 [Aspergillus vadensis CBS 113365]PYH74655.1 hypothetical protein BO88DRAFT_18892 [Aspergillus vadensis CBS 113365]
MPRARQLGVLAAKKQTRTRTTLSPPLPFRCSCPGTRQDQPVSWSCSWTFRSVSFCLGKGNEREKKSRPWHSSYKSPYLPFRSCPPFLSSPPPPPLLPPLFLRFNPLPPLNSPPCSGSLHPSPLVPSGPISYKLRYMP